MSLEDRVVLDFLRRRAYQEFFSPEVDFSGDEKRDMKVMGEQVEDVVYRGLLDCGIKAPKGDKVQESIVFTKEGKVVTLKYEFKAGDAEDVYSKRTTGYDSVEARVEKITGEIRKLLVQVFKAYGMVEEPSVRVTYHRDGPDNIDLENVEVGVSIELALKS